jgi:hypothetical protein
MVTEKTGGFREIVLQIKAGSCRSRPTWLHLDQSKDFPRTRYSHSFPSDLVLSEVGVEVKGRYKVKEDVKV